MAGLFSCAGKARLIVTITASGWHPAGDRSSDRVSQHASVSRGDSSTRTGCRDTMSFLDGRGGGEGIE
jgi:hypothetical protein